MEMYCQVRNNANHLYEHDEPETDDERAFAGFMVKIMPRNPCGGAPSQQGQEQQRPF